MDPFKRFLGITRYSWFMIVLTLAAAAMFYFYLGAHWIGWILVCSAVAGGVLTYDSSEYTKK